MFPGSRKKPKVSDEVRFDKLSPWINKAKQRSVLNMEKQQNAMLLYTQNVLRNSMESDRLTA